MRVLCTAKGFTLTEGLQMQVDERIRLSLDRVSHLVRSVRVLLCDENGPKGGRDKRCTVELELLKGGRIVRKSVAADAYAAIGQSFQRIERALLGLAKRRRARRGEISETVKE
ncbi:MAG: HPF/RaiA family ribosome-associated protein [Proteobacteria bacterium]|nr:HPF/RaiA family ribosome-associated protein [Pseudomonadota bacterium]